MNEAGKGCTYIIMIVLLFITLFLLPAMIGIGELAERDRIEQGGQVRR